MKLGMTAARVDGSARGIMGQIKGYLSGLGWHRQTKVAEVKNQTPNKVEVPTSSSPDARPDTPA